MGGFKACRFTDQDGRVLPEYDFSQAIHNKYASRYAAGSAVVVLDPGAAAAFRVAAELVALDDAMSTLAEIDPRKAEVFSAR